MRHLKSRRRFARALASRSRTRRLLVEGLEPRTLLAPLPLASDADELFATPSSTTVPPGGFVLEGQTLFVSGTGGNDDIWLQSKRNGLHLWINGKRNGPFRPSSVEVNGVAGNDFLHADAKFNIPLTLIGGPGRDRLVGGNGADVLQGDIGDDTLDGGGGNDQLDGATGAIRCAGGAAMTN